MSTTPQLGLNSPDLNTPNWHTPLNANWTLLDQLAGMLLQLAVRPTETPSTTLNVQVGAGTFRKKSDGSLVAYAGTASQAIPSGATRYLSLTDAGVLTVGTAWPSAGTAHVRLAVVVAGTSTITSIVDARVFNASIAT